MQVKQMFQEVIWVLGDQSEGLQCGVREILQIERHDCLSLTPDRSGYDMPVFRVRKLNGLLKAFKPGHDSIADMGVHQVPHAYDLLVGQIGPSGDDRPLHFIENSL